MSGSYIQLDDSIWVEMPDRKVYRSGNVYVGKGYKKGYDIKVFIRKLEE